MKKRFSAQKKMIEDTLTMLDHPTATQVYEHIRKDYPQISLGTVYRNLGAMSDEGEVLRLSFANAPDRFDINTQEHFHAACSRCGRIFDTDGKLPPGLLEKLDADMTAAACDYEKLNALLAERDAVQAALDELYEKWEALSEAAE